MSGQSPKIDLQIHENLGGHTIRDHVGRDAAWLVSRLALDPQITLASSFTDRATAEKCVNAGLHANLPAFLRWRVSLIRANLTFSYDMGTMIGYGVVQGAVVATPMTKFKMVFRKAPVAPKGYLLTSFPVP